MNLRVDEVERWLHDRLRAGRTPVEAVGERLWLTALEQEADIVSGQFRDDMTQVVMQWLRTLLSLKEEHLSAYRWQAERYAEHLRATVDLADPTAVMKVDSAWLVWRAGQ